MRKKPWRLLAERPARERNKQRSLICLFQGSEAKLEAYEDAQRLRLIRRRAKKCEEYVVLLLTSGPMEFLELWCELDMYRDVREGVLANMRLVKMIKKFCAVDTDRGRIIGGYALNKDHEKVRKILT